MKQALRDVDDTFKGIQSGPDNSVVTTKVDVPKASWADFRRHFGQWKNGKVLLGTSWSWFALDVRAVFSLYMIWSLTPPLPSRSLSTVLDLTPPSSCKPSVSGLRQNQDPSRSIGT